VNARFVLWEAEDVLRVPTSALFRNDGGWAVLAVVHGRAVLRSVEPGRRGARLTRVLSGLEPGEMVIVHPDHSIESGTRVRLRQPPAAARSDDGRS